MKVEVQLNFYDIKILVNGLPHVYLSRKEFVGFQSYFENESKCSIEFHCKGGVVVTTEYDSMDKWKAVLRELNKKL